MKTLLTLAAAGLLLAACRTASPRPARTPSKTATSGRGVITESATVERAQPTVAPALQP